SSETGNTEAFALANDATTRTGLTPLHGAASRGHIEIVQWRAIADIEDKEGETALHKAALNGHLHVVEYLISSAGADVHSQDGDGWTPLHNACSKGYLDIVRYLCNHGATQPSNDPHASLSGVDVKSKGGWTPL
ncbi:1883_t:CDS:2, partial [Acaulospora colombiana]